MALVVNIDVQWANGRLVHVHCVGEPVVPERSRGYEATAPVPLDTSDVGSLDALRGFLADATQIAPDQGIVEVVGFEPDVFKIFKVLGIEGPPPDPIILKLTQP
jgi:hypothetical protein